jgi:hypothetical protein
MLWVLSINTRSGLKWYLHDRPLIDAQPVLINGLFLSLIYFYVYLNHPSISYQHLERSFCNAGWWQRAEGLLSSNTLAIELLKWFLGSLDGGNVLPCSVCVLYTICTTNQEIPDKIIHPICRSGAITVRFIYLRKNHSQKSCMLMCNETIILSPLSLSYHILVRHSSRVVDLRSISWALLFTSNHPVPIADLIKMHMKVTRLHSPFSATTMGSDTMGSDGQQHAMLSCIV